MTPGPLTPQAEMHHLPRLAPEHYRGFAAVLWTITFEGRTTGWMDPLFHAAFRELLVHASAREHLFCPAYVLMPDHIHLFWLGLRLVSDQRNAMRFLRKQLQAELKQRSTQEGEYQLQKQSHDRVLHWGSGTSRRPVHPLVPSNQMAALYRDAATLGMPLYH